MNVIESLPAAFSVAPETPPITVEEWQHRFKVVKIVSKEPRKRGRWYCMDFNDPPAPPIENIINNNKPLESAPSNNQSSNVGINNNNVTNVNLSTFSTQELSFNPPEVLKDVTTFDHLMVAVKSEVIVLRERITELMNKISHLEFENSILRAHATPETLSLLSQNPNQPSTHQDHHIISNKENQNNDYLMNRLKSLKLSVNRVDIESTKNIDNVK